MIVVGQKLYWVPANSCGMREQTVVVAKVGRKWAQITPPAADKINITTLIADGGIYSSPGRCYLSKEDFDKELALEQEWASLRGLLGHGKPPAGVTVDDIRQAKKLLKKLLRLVAL